MSKDCNGIICNKCKHLNDKLDNKHKEMNGIYNSIYI